jgi:peroxiredoxin family protein/TusA-related sulfurtransferase
VSSAGARADERSTDVSAMQCPGPIVRVRQELDEMSAGQVLSVVAARSFRSDLESWTASAGHRLLEVADVDGQLRARIQKGDGGAPAVPVSGGGNLPETATLVVFSNDLDRTMASFIIATGLASLGVKVTMFFTFWGLTVLRKEYGPSVAKDFLSRMFGFMLPKGPRKLALSKMHMLGMGTAMMKHVMGKKNVTSLPDLIGEARRLGVQFVACDMAMNVMGIQREELIDGVDDVAGVAKFAALAKDSGTTLFI